VTLGSFQHAERRDTGFAQGAPQFVGARGRHRQQSSEEVGAEAVERRGAAGGEVLRRSP